MKRKRNVIKVFGLILILVLILVLSSGCIGKSEQEKKAEKVKEEALAYIEDLYGEEFVINKVRYISATGVWELTAAPKDDQELEFFVKKGGKYGKQFSANYGINRLIREATIHYRSVVKNIFNCRHRSWANIYTDGKFENIPGLKKVLENAAEKSYANVFIYIFEDVITRKEKKEEFLANVMELLEYLRGQNLKYATIQISIYDEEFFRDKDIDHILEVSRWFQGGTNEFDVWEYKKKMRYNLIIFEKSFREIKSKKDIENLISVVYPK